MTTAAKGAAGPVSAPAPPMSAVAAGGGAGPGATSSSAEVVADAKSAVKGAADLDIPSVPVGPAANERECCRQLNWLWTSARIGLPINELNAIIAAFVAAPKRTQSHFFVLSRS